jgi:hypothetical protein
VDLLQQIGIGFEFGRALGRGTLEAAGLARDVVDDAIHDESERAQNQDDNNEHREAPRHEPREILDRRMQERRDRHRGQGPGDHAFCVERDLEHEERRREREHERQRTA